MKRKILSLLLTLCMVLTLLPASVLATETEIADYDALAAAFTPADGVITVTSDITVTGEVDTFASENSIAVADGATVTIANGGALVSGVEVKSGGAVTVAAGGTLAATMGAGIENSGAITVHSGTNSVRPAQLVLWKGGGLNNAGTLTMNGDLTTDYYVDDGGGYTGPYVASSGTVDGGGKIFMGSLPSGENSLYDDLEEIFPTNEQGGSFVILDGAPVYTEAELYAALKGGTYEAGGGYWSSYHIMAPITVTRDYVDFARNLTIDGFHGSLTMDGNVTFCPVFGGDYYFEVVRPQDVDAGATTGTLTAKNGAEVCLVTANYGGIINVESGSYVEFGGYGEGAGQNLGTVNVAAGGTLANTQGGHFLNEGVIDLFGNLNAVMGGWIENRGTITLYEGAAMTLSGSKYSTWRGADAQSPTGAATLDATSASTSVFVPFNSDDTAFVLPSITRTGYVFGGWSDGANTYSAGNTYSFPDTGEVTLTAQWSVPYTPSPAPSVSLPATGDGPKVSATVRGETASLKVSAAELEKASGRVKLDLSALNQTVTAAAIPANTLAKLAEKADEVTITLTGAAVTLDAAALTKAAGMGSGSVTLSVTEYDKAPLDSAVQTVIGDRPVYELSLKAGTTDLHALGGKATVSLPYTPKAGETPEYLVVWRMVDGIPQPLACKYDAATGKAVFETETFSLYVVAYFPFTDVAADSWYYAPAAYAYMTGLMSGTGAGCFSPDTTVSRAMLTTMLWALDGKPTSAASAFTDVPDGAWYADAVAWAAASGVVSGHDDGSFDPNGPVTREQLAAMLYAYAKHKGYDLSATAELSEFSDGGEISGYAVPALRWACANGLLTGKEGGLLDPTGTATRAETATILRQFSAKPVK